MRKKIPFIVFTSRKTPFRTEPNFHSSRLSDKPGPMPGIGPGSSCQGPVEHWYRFGWGHSSRLVARTRTKAVAEALVPVGPTNRDECPSFGPGSWHEPGRMPLPSLYNVTPPPSSSLLCYFFSRIGGKWVLVFISFATHKMCSMKCPSHT